MRTVYEEAVAYWHLLLQRYCPELAAGVRVIESTATAPIPTFVASPAVSTDVVDRLAISFRSARAQPWFPALADALLIEGFESVPGIHAFKAILARAQQAQDAGYPSPA